MLKYIVTVTEDLLQISVMITLLYAFLSMTYERRGKISQSIAIIAAVIASGVMAIVKNQTSKIATNRWNMYIFYVAIIATVVFILFSLLLFNYKKKTMGFGEFMIHLSAGTLTGALIFYELPDVMAYPFLFDTAGKGVISVEFLLRLIGWILALILMVVLVSFLHKAVMAFGSRKMLLLVLDLAILTNAARFAGLVLSKWLAAPKWLKWPTFRSEDHPWAFPYAKFVANNTLLFGILITVFALIIPVLLYVRSLRVKEPFDNRAQERKLIARNRSYRRFAVTVAVCAVIAIVNLTAIKAYDSRIIELSPPEEYEIVGEEVFVPVDQLEDGHLHRFEYNIPDGGDVRWIAIKKPGAASYGVGLDACSVCGDAGYFERNGQVVCKRCDVVMNINTIGFKGGCNPIPLEYRVENGYIIIPLQAIIDGEKHFK